MSFEVKLDIELICIPNGVFGIFIKLYTYNIILDNVIT